MTKKLVVAVLVAPLVILALSATVCAFASSTPLSNQDYSVYSALVRHKFRSEDGHFVANEKYPLLIRRRTEALPNAPFQLLVFVALVEDPPSTSPAAAPLSMKRSQIARSWLDSSLEQRFDVDFPYRVVDEASGEISGPNAEPYLTLSRIGFNSDSTTALVDYAFICGMCGGGGYMILERGESGWEVVEDVQQWSS